MQKKEKKEKLRMKRWRRVWNKNMEVKKKTTMMVVWNQGKLSWTQSRTSKTISTLTNKIHQMVVTPNQTNNLKVKKSKKKSKKNTPLLNHKSGNHHSNNPLSQFHKKQKSNSVAY